MRVHDHVYNTALFLYRVESLAIFIISSVKHLFDFWLKLDRCLCVDVCDVARILSICTRAPADGEAEPTFKMQAIAGLRRWHKEAALRVTEKKKKKLTLKGYSKVMTPKPYFVVRASI